jgi:hypothetical protein
MGFAYTPGLTVAAYTVVRKVRRLPLKGQVLVKVGQRVLADEVVAETSLPGPVKTINVVGKLGIAPEDLREMLLKKDGDPVKAGEPFVRTKGLFGLFKSELQAPVDGTLESVSEVTGQVIFRGLPTPLQKRAYAAGEIVETHESESATVQVRGSYIQGIFGIGGEAHGDLAIVVDNPDTVLAAERVKPEHGGVVSPAGCRMQTCVVSSATIWVSPSGAMRSSS